jgi:flagellar motor switch protein FliM
MTATAMQRSALHFAFEGERVRRASSVLEREATQLAAALRRAVPFLARRGVPVTLSYARATPISELVADLPRPLYAMPLIADPSGGRGALVLDANAIAVFLDGALGGNGTSLPALNEGGLTSAQSALMARLARGIVPAFSDVLSARAGVRLRAAAPDAGEAEMEGALIACALEFAVESNVARVILLLPKESLLPAADESDAPPARTADRRVEAVLDDVELEVVAELGRVPMKLSDAACLRVGDTLRLDLLVGAPVTVRADGRALMKGRPSTSGGRIVVRIEPGHER